MSGLFIPLFLVSLVCLVIGIARPSTFRFSTRKRAAIVFGIATIIFFTGVAITAPPQTPSPEVAATKPLAQSSTVSTSGSDVQKTQTVTPPVQTSPAAAVPASTDDVQKTQIEQIVRSVPSSGMYLGGGTITNIDVYHVPDLNDASKFIGWGVDVNLHIEGSRAVMNEEMAEIYYALYSNRKDITAVAVSVYESVTDKYGNQSDMEIYHTFLKSDVASKVNWSLGHDGLVYSVLPDLWTVNLDMTASNPNLLAK